MSTKSKSVPPTPKGSKKSAKQPAVISAAAQDPDSPVFGSLTQESDSEVVQLPELPQPEAQPAQKVWQRLLSSDEPAAAAAHPQGRSPRAPTPTPVSPPETDKLSLPRAWQEETKLKSVQLHKERVKKVLQFEKSAARFEKLVETGTVPKNMKLRLHEAATGPQSPELLQILRECELKVVKCARDDTHKYLAKARARMDPRRVASKVLLKDKVLVVNAERQIVINPQVAEYEELYLQFARELLPLLDFKLKEMEMMRKMKLLKVQEAPERRLRAQEKARLATTEQTLQAIATKVVDDRLKKLNIERGRHKSPPRRGPSTSRSRSPSRSRSKGRSLSPRVHFKGQKAAGKNAKNLPAPPSTGTDARQSSTNRGRGGSQGRGRGGRGRGGRKAAGTKKQP